MICKNSADTIVECLESWKPVISYWCILDTGSTDGTQELIKKTMANIPGRLYEEPFQGFSKSRNRCFELAGTRCLYNIMPDDSYNLVGHRALINQVKGKFYPVISIKIKERNSKYPELVTEYWSKRITMSQLGIKYVGKIHEDIEYGSDLKLAECYIEDVPKGTQFQRSIDRKKYDLEQLTNTPRDVYYRAMTYLNMRDREKAEEFFKQRIEMKDSDLEEQFMSFIHLGHLTDDVKFYLRAAMLFPQRSGEAYFFIYLKNGSKHFLQKAYENRVLGKCRLPVERCIYDRFIPEAYIENIYGL